MIMTMPTVRTTRAISFGSSLHLHVAIDEHRDEERVDAGDRAGLGRREHAGQDAAEDDHDGDHAPDRVERDLERLAQRDDLALREVVAGSAMMSTRMISDRPEQQRRDDAAP